MIMKFKNTRFVFIGIVAIIAIIAIIIAATKKENKNNNESEIANSVVYQDNLRLGISNYDTINPLLTRNKQLMDIEQLVFEPLLKLDSNYKINLCLASEYAKTSPTTYIIKINTSIKWSDGTNLNANDVKYTIDNLKSTNSIYSENVKNISSVEVLDDNTIKINLTEETFFFEYNLIFPIMCKNYYGDENCISSSKTPIGTGLYKISEVSTNQIVLEKNENYRDQDKANKNVNRIYINLFKEVGEVYNSFKIGNIDIMNTSSPLYENYIGKIGYYVKEYKGRELDFLSCNCNDYLMKNKSIRQAINYAIDRENIVSTIYNNKYYTSDYILDYGSYLYNKNNTSSGYNPEKARDILNQDGWVYSNNRWRKNGQILAITISVNSSNSRKMRSSQKY